MFLKEFEKFNKLVETTIFEFFGANIDEAKKMQDSLELWYKQKYKLDEVEFININPDDRENICKYKTLKYFNTILDKLNELKIALRGADDDNTGI